MNTEFYSLQLSRLEALECLKALLTQTLIDDELRAQKGLEAGELSPVISRLVQVLRRSDEEVERETDASANDLWEYSWYAFTSEWAWYRAQQEALRTLKKNMSKVDLACTEYQAFAEKNFKQFFEKYVAELNMKPLHNSNSKISKKSKSNFGS
ncbi:hypothetical protein GF391_00470 [Candidatus Uhrbacteria bacterium]|nr:hypothetical protein [Candidatus Uhrbacteria bacterium]